MARLNDDAQWIVLMGFLVSFSFFFLTLVINQSTVVGQTTAESVIEFPKNDIRDVKSIVIQSSFSSPDSRIQNDITNISLSRKSAVVDYTLPFTHDCVPEDTTYNCTTIHYNNGVTEYNENWISP
ncbi:MAG: hypothetical protein Q7V05_06045 [Methanoregula sp.]|nr:hypothetical protein [Methanoregula sp.]